MRFRVLALLALPLCLIVACGEEGPPPPPPIEPTVAPPPANAALVAQGREEYVRFCALCHGDQAQGYAADHANALANADFLAVADDAFLRAAIIDGRPGTPMSAWGAAHGGPLNDGQVTSIVAYLRSLATAQPIDVREIRVRGEAARGAAPFAEHCARCHGDQGQGSDVATSLSHPNFQRTVSDGYVRETIVRGRRGTPMPPFAQLPSQTIDDLVSFVRRLERAPEAPVPTGPPPPDLDHLVINPTGQPPRFTLRDDRYVSSADVKRALDEGKRMVILDARAASDWARAHIPGAAPFPFYDIAQMAERLPRDGTFVLAYCACPHAASGHVVDALRERGFEHTAVIDEGIGFWQDQQYPVESGSVPTAPP